MIDSSTLTFKQFINPRTKSHPVFTEGMSGPLKIAASTSGKKYIVKYACHHNAANELVGSWLGQRIGAPVPQAYLLTPSDKFKQPYGVAIEFLDNLKPVSILTDQMKQDVCTQFTLSTLIDSGDSLQISESNGRIYSLDFSEGFQAV